MSRYPDIWSRLQEYEVSPPRELFDKVFAQVMEEESMVKGGELLWKGDESIKGSMQRLEDHEVQPPVALRRSVEDELFKRGTRKPFRLVAIRTAAACLILGLAGWLIYRATLSQKTSVSAANKNIAQMPAGTDASNSLSAADSLSKAESLSAGDSLAGNAIDDSGTVVKAGRYHQPRSFHINGQPFPLVDNDLLVSWANFNYTEMGDFFKGAGSEGWKIHLDQYTNIFVSKTMSGLMKDMNQFKANGNPTRKARKSREKLDKWKKADAAQFDRSLQTNPLDPIDLAEFIFK
ncbi:MAG TPA: hypothetical protein VL832_08095 [Puia sp.]|nr:hypothetical protein [Puia sp.]